MAIEFLSQPLTQLVIKPTVFCYHRCSYCGLRQEYYDNLVAGNRRRVERVPNKATRLANPGHLSLDVACGAIDEAAALGMTSLQFSGGDPLLYPHLVDLIRAGARHPGVFVFMNSVGTGVSVVQAESIVGAGLGAWNFSIDTLDPGLYDRVRGVRDGLATILTAVDTVRRAAREWPEFCVNYMAVLTRHNFRGLPDLLAHCVDTNVASLYLMNVYGDRNALLNEAEIREFRDEIVPGMLEVLADRRVPRVVADNAEAVLATFYSPDAADDQYTRGVYWADHDAAIRACQAPNYYLLIEPDGRVLPCCQVEIAHHGEAGSLMEESLTQIWNGARYAQFRRDRIPFCRECSAPRHMTLGLVPKMCRQFRG